MTARQYALPGGLLLTVRRAVEEMNGAIEQTKPQAAEPDMAVDVIAVPDDQPERPVA